ncbi:MAG: hypothetical protein ACOY3Z_11450 [Thermodesulfobacteriota bacterium]
MTLPDFLAMLGSLSLFAIAVVLVPTLIRLQHTLRRAEELLASLHAQSAPLCDSLTNAANEVRTLAVNMGQRLDTVENAAQTAKHAADIFLTTSRLLRETTRPVITSLGGVLAGISAFSHMLGGGKKKP